MSNYFINAPTSKFIKINEENEKEEQKKKSKSQLKYAKAPDIMTQAKPSYLNNFVLPINPHESSLTPSNHSNKLNNTEKSLLPPKSDEFSNKKTLILDLDETLVHSSFSPFEKNDIILEVDFEGIIYNIYVLVRPHATEFLKNMSKFFEIVIFTASISKYASPLLDILDKEKNIKHRLFRDHCTYINGIFIKDLKKLNRNLKDLIIVDNSPLAYAFDSENGLPIKTWYDDPEDIELKKIEPLIIFLSKIKDVRKYIDKFVDDNEIMYNEAMSIINNYEKNKNKISSLKDINDNSDDESDSNNIKLSDKFKLIDYKMNTLNLMKNKKFNLFSFNNLARINNSTNNNNISNNMPLNRSDNEKNNIIIIENNKQGNNTINNNKFEPMNESNNIINNNNINQSDSKNNKNTVRILLRKESSKKKNIFRLNQKPNELLFNLKINKINEINKNFATNSFFNNIKNSNNNTNNLMPLVLPFSNTSKNILEPKKALINTNNKINIIPIHMTKNDSEENKKKIKYSNLLEKFERNGNFRKNEIKNNFKFYKNSENIKISSSISNNNNQGLLPINLYNQNGKIDKKYELLQIPKSNSINDVLKFNRLGIKTNINKHLEAKTPNRNLINVIAKENNNNYIFNQKIGKKNMLFNLIRGIGFSKTGRSKNISNSANPQSIRSYSKSSQRKKREYN